MRHREQKTYHRNRKLQNLPPGDNALSADIATRCKPLENNLFNLTALCISSQKQLKAYVLIHRWTYVLPAKFVNTGQDWKNYEIRREDQTHSKYIRIWR